MADSSARKLNMNQVVEMVRKDDNELSLIRVKFLIVA